MMGAWALALAVVAFSPLAASRGMKVRPVTWGGSQAWGGGGGA